MLKRTLAESISLNFALCDDASLFYSLFLTASYIERNTVHASDRQNGSWIIVLDNDLFSPEYARWIAGNIHIDEWLHVKRENIQMEIYKHKQTLSYRHPQAHLHLPSVFVCALVSFAKKQVGVFRADAAQPCKGTLHSRGIWCPWWNWR